MLVCVSRIRNDDDGQRKERDEETQEKGILFLKKKKRRTWHIVDSHLNTWKVSCGVVVVIDRASSAKGESAHTILSFICAFTSV